MWVPSDLRFHESFCIGARCEFTNHWVDVNLCQSIDLAGTKGIEGNADRITPFEVRIQEGVTRSDLLIHRDAHVRLVDRLLVSGD